MKEHKTSYSQSEDKIAFGLKIDKGLTSRFESFLSNIGERYTFFSLTNGILNFASKGISRITKTEPREVIGQYFKDILYWTDESLNNQFEQIKKLMEQEADYVEYEMRFYDNHRILRTLNVIQHATFDRKGSLISIDGIAEEITQRKNLELENSYLQNIINEFAVYVKTDASGTIVEASDSFYREFKGNEDFFIGKKINIIQSGKTSDLHYQKLWKAIQAGNIFEHDIQNCNLDMERHWYHVKIVPQLDNKNSIDGYMAFYHNIDDKVKLRKEAHTDPLTGLTNRQYLLDIQMQINLKDYDVMMIDLDHFKQVNDSYGHHIGDKVLKSVAKIIQKHTRSDDILIRYGGEEFLFLLYNPTNNIGITKNISERIRLNVQKVEKECKDFHIRPTVSIGIESHTERTKSLDEAILHADEMLYLAKRRGRNRIEFYDEINSLQSRSFKNKITVTEIKGMIEENHLICHYQPIVNARREIDKYESLVRLVDKEGALMMPDAFLPIIKNTNIYADLTKKVIEYNFRFFKNREGDFTFNLSFSDLLNESIVTIILNELEAHPRMAKRLTIELLEDEMIDDFDAIEQVMLKLRELGIKFAIDDFGSGYANFGNIFKLHFDYLKINGELIRNIETSEYSRNMLESLSAFAKKAHVKTIAEYIEDEKIFESVKKYGIDLYQGYFIGKPTSELFE